MRKVLGLSMFVLMLLGSLPHTGYAQIRAELDTKRNVVRINDNGKVSEVDVNVLNNTHSYDQARKRGAKMYQYNDKSLDPKWGFDQRDLMSRHQDKIISDAVRAYREGSDSLDIYFVLSDDGKTSRPVSVRRRYVCENTISYRNNGISNAQYELLRQDSVFVDREAQFRLIAEVKYDIWVDQVCWTEKSVDYGPWRKSGSDRTYSGVASTQVYDPKGIGYDEFHPKSVDVPRTRVRQINNTTFGVTWTEVGPKGTTDYIQGTVILNNKSKFKKLKEAGFSSQWKGAKSASVWRENYVEPEMLVYDLDQGVNVQYKLHNRVVDTVEVEGVAATRQ